jgi:ABC-2 type transport system permease protein
MLLGGLMIPSSMLPPALFRLSLLLPTVHAMNAWKSLAFNMAPVIPPSWSVLTLLFSGVCAFILAIYLFNWDSKNRLRGRNPLLGLITWIPYILCAIFLAK